MNGMNMSAQWMRVPAGRRRDSRRRGVAEPHLAACQDCAGFALAISDTAQALRSFPMMASSSLVEATKARVHARANQLREREARRFLIAISFALGMVVSTMSA